MNIPDAKIIHLEGESFDVESARINHYMKGKLIFYKKNYGKFTCNILNFIIWLTIYSRIIILTFSMNTIKLKIWKDLARTFKAIKREIKEYKYS
jgi:GT2 family glycosyltransferase